MSSEFTRRSFLKTACISIGLCMRAVLIPQERTTNRQPHATCLIVMSLSSALAELDFAPQ